MNKLPLVSPAIAGSLKIALDEKMEKDYIQDKFDFLDDNNPTISFFIKKMAKSSKDKKMVAMCGILVYMMLQSQLESDFMSQSIPLE